MNTKDTQAETARRAAWRREVEAQANDENNGTVENISNEARQWLYFRHVHEMPLSVAKARTGDPYEWLDQHALPEYRT